MRSSPFVFAGGGENDMRIVAAVMEVMMRARGENDSGTVMMTKTRKKQGNTKRCVCGMFILSFPYN